MLNRVRFVNDLRMRKRGSSAKPTWSLQLEAASNVCEWVPIYPADYLPNPLRIR